VTEVINESGLPLKPVYVAEDRHGDEPAPGTFPFTRGIHKDMYRGRLWTMRQYAGFGTAAESNKRYKFLLKQGQTGLSVAFDLPTQIGYDSDHPMANGEVGKVGVAIDSLEDMEILLKGIPLDKVSTSMTINATASMLLLLYQLVAEKQGCPPEKITGTVQNDILKEYAARGTYIFPPKPSMRLITDLFAYCHGNLPNWNTISISGYHIREAGSTAAEEIALTLSHAIAYVGAAQAAGLTVDEVGPHLSFFFAAHMDFFEEVAKFRSARRMWARIMRDRFKAKDDRSLALRFHTQTGGVTLTAQQPLNNVVRTALEAMSAVLGGTQSLHTNAYDEALGLPSESAAGLALKTQQVIGHETAVPLVADPLETGWTQRRIADSAYRLQRRIESGERVVVGVNRFVETDAEEVEITRISPRHQAAQARALKKLRARRKQAIVDRHLAAIERAARGTDNLMPPLKAALADYVTIGECCEVLRGVFGEYRPTEAA
jgi:methylmalonyl-CoA mutase N-terminal domain/subunit